MQVVSSDLPNNCRLYKAPSGDYVRVTVTVESANKGSYSIVAAVTDSAGVDLGPETDPFILTHCIEDTDTPPLGLGRTNGAKKGNLAIDGGILFESDGAEWIERGPIPDGASVAAAEIINEWDKAGQRVAERAVRAWSRQSAKTEVNALIGA